MDEQQQTFTTQAKKQKNNYILHIGLFLMTFITTTIAGAEWTSGLPGPYELSFLLTGLPYALAILLVITCHEFGHYFAAKYHRVSATLPYYIPFPTVPGLLSFGTMGAVIKTRTPVPTKNAMFDIGAAGPIAGFVACLIILIAGFVTVPGKEYILAIHPDYFSPEYGKGAINLTFGDTLLFSFLRLIFVHPGQFFPPMSEIYHYPLLCVGWFGLFITSMNMIPVGQLDGGHISFTMFGNKRHYTISIVTLFILLFMGITGAISSYMEVNITFGWTGWLVWSLVLFFIIRPKHPPIPDFAEISRGRRMVGYVTFIIFLISFSPNPISIGF